MKLNGKNVQQAIDAKTGRGEYLAPGLRNAAVKGLSDTYEAAETVPKGSKIALGNLNAGIVPAFALVSSTKYLAGSIGTLDRPDLFGSFAIDGTATMSFPPEPNKPLKKSGEVFILTDADFDAGKISAKIFYTQ